MDVKKYIATGVLELYVAGQLSEKKNSEVYDLSLAHPEISSEIVAIEAAVLALSKTAAPNYTNDFKSLQKSISPQNDSDVISLNKKTNNWISYLGWAASVLLAVGIYWMYNQNNNLRSEIELAEKSQLQLENQIAESNASLEKSQALLITLRDKNITGILLGGQEVSPDSYAKAYWNKKEQKVFIDAKGLPKPPEGMVYQVWSLKLNPLTPTSMGLLEDFDSDENKVFALTNPNETEAFGITLEPSGGSASPNLDQLYTLGVVTSP